MKPIIVLRGTLIVGLASLFVRMLALGLAFLVAEGCVDDATRQHGAPAAAPADAAPSDPGPRDATTQIDDGRGATVGDAKEADTGAAGDGAGEERDAGIDREAGHTLDDGAPAEDGSALGASKIPGWSVRKQVVSPNGQFVLEEVLTSFTQAAPGANRIQLLGPDGSVRHSYDAPTGAYLSDFCVHPSGHVSAVLIDADQTVSLVRLDGSLTPLVTTAIHDPQIPNDAPVDGGPKDLFANGFTRDAARIASVDDDVIAVVYSSFYSVIAYRASYANGTWSPPERTLVEPPLFLAPFLPIGGTFDTFGAIVAWYRAVLDTDEDGNAFIAIWAHPVKIRAHSDAFHDGLVPLGHFPDSDVLLTRVNRDGSRAWTRVVGTQFEDEPYAIRARRGKVAVVGRSRRFFGFDNTAWDAFFSVSSTAGDLLASRALPFDASSILLAVDAVPSGGWLLGGSDGWSQNPEGLSIVSFGSKLLVELPSEDSPPLRHVVPPGPRHNEVRSVVATTERFWYAGHEDGPIMHTGDADLSLIYATGVVGALGR